MAEQSITVKLPFQLNDSGNIANITDVLDYLGEEMAEIESQEIDDASWRP